MIITQVEDAIITRLRTGMGRMVQEVGSYGGELDEGLGEVIRRFPAAWVTFGGVNKTEKANTTGRKFKVTGQFVVMVGARNVRSEAASRRGGPTLQEVGSYSLIYAVRRLLATQSLGMPIDPLMPGRVRTLYNTRLERQAFSVFACEYQTAWIEEALDANAWPAPEGPEHPDALFPLLGGKTEAPQPWLGGFNVGLYQPGKDTPSITFETDVNEENPS